jgi:hypothetical protein
VPHEILARHGGVRAATAALKAKLTRALKASVQQEKKRKKIYRGLMQSCWQFEISQPHRAVLRKLPFQFQKWPQNL